MKLSSSAPQQLSSSAPKQHGNLAGQKLTKKKRAAAQQLSSPAAWQLSRKETTAQNLSRTWDRYCCILTDCVSLVFHGGGKKMKGCQNILFGGESYIYIFFSPKNAKKMHKLQPNTNLQQNSVKYKLDRVYVRSKLNKTATRL